MPNYGFNTQTTNNFGNTIHTAIQKQVVDTLRQGLVALPRGAVVPSTVLHGNGNNFTMRVTEYPDLVDAVGTTTLTEGVAPAGTKLGISTLDYDVAQKGAWTQVTDIAMLQSPHDVMKIAADKIARLAVQTIDNIALAALNAHAVDATLTTGLTTSALLNAKVVLQSRGVEPIANVGYYAILHPFALRGLEGESNSGGYVDVTSLGNSGELTKGAVGQYRGFTFLVSPRAASGTFTNAIPAAGNAAIAATDTITTTGNHGLTAGNRIRIVSITGGAGLAASTNYYVKSVPSATTFTVSATLGGATIDITTDSSAISMTSESFPIHFLGKDSIAFGDVSSITYHSWSEAGPGNELQQLAGVGFKGILGGKVLSFAETTDGAGNNSSTTDRVYTIAVNSGIA